MEIKRPSGETVFVWYYDIKHTLRFILTAKTSRDYYFLYEIVDGKCVKLGRSTSPRNLEEKFEVYKNCVN